jgi:hypothetical protein
MKTSLATFPKKHSKEVAAWKEAFEKEIIEQWKQIEQFKERLGSVAFINVGVQEAQFKGEILQIKEVLGLPILTQFKDLPSSLTQESRGKE